MNTLKMITVEKRQPSNNIYGVGTYMDTYVMIDGILFPQQGPVRLDLLWFFT
jgi:hypothetical protein